MSKIWIIIDSNYLLTRNFYAMNKEPKMAIWRFLSDIVKLQNNFNTQNVVFCFDEGAPKRLAIYPEYKQTRYTKRKFDTQEDKDARNELYKLIEALYKGILTNHSYLSIMGYRNIFWQNGYEADDLIASVCACINQLNDQALIVANDSDLYQLLNTGNVEIWNPKIKKILTENWLHQEYGVNPKQWVMLKAIAGDNSDSIKGIEGVGLNKASQFLTKQMKTTSNTWNKIIYGKKIIDENLKLIKLPYPGTMKINLCNNELSYKKWMTGLKVMNQNVIPPNSIKRAGAKK